MASKKLRRTGVSTELCERLKRHQLETCQVRDPASNLLICYYMNGGGCCKRVCSVTCRMSCPPHPWSSCAWLDSATPRLWISCSCSVKPAHRLWAAWVSDPISRSCRWLNSRSLSLLVSDVFLMMTGMGFVEEEGRAVFLHITSCPGQTAAWRTATGCSHWGSLPLHLI